MYTAYDVQQFLEFRVTVMNSQSLVYSQSSWTVLNKITNYFPAVIAVSCTVEPHFHRIFWYSCIYIHSMDHCTLNACTVEPDYLQLPKNPTKCGMTQQMAAINRFIDWVFCCATVSDNQVGCYNQRSNITGATKPLYVHDVTLEEF